MPARGSAGGEYWTRDHLDTAETLKYIHIQIAANVVPDVEEFLRTPIGQQLAQKWGAGTKGTKKVKYNFAGTLARYKEWRDTGGGGGEPADHDDLSAVSFILTDCVFLPPPQETLPVSSYLAQVYPFLKATVQDKVV